MPSWNLWHGCQKISAGCLNCYVYRIDKSHSKTDSFIVRKNEDFDLPLRKDRSGNYKLKPSDEPVFTCMTSDFFVEDADIWRPDAWKMIKQRQDLHFFIITKRIHRAEKQLPPDWGDGYDNVTICCTTENQKMADFRLPIFKALPIKHRQIACEPLLEQLDIEKYLDGIESVVAGGESGLEARLCKFEWILSLREQCLRQKCGFYFKQTGANFEKDGKVYKIPRKMQHPQAAKANLNLVPPYLKDKLPAYFHGEDIE